MKIEHPFLCIIDQNFLEEEHFRLLRAEILSCNDWTEKSNDLYDFRQTNDLKSNNTPRPAVQKLVNKLTSSEFIEKMIETTGISLSGSISLSAHRYQQNGYLLCHDDDVGTGKDIRRIAFILYLVQPDWKLEEGGCLQLFDCDSNGDPRHITHSILPKQNQFAFFEVLPTSHHQVQQVYGSRDRLSISGWFHGPKSVNTRQKLNPRTDLSYWINPAYLQISSIGAIATAMTNDSFLQLKKFLIEDRYLLLKAAMLECCFKQRLGIANQGKYHVIQDEDNLSETYSIISQFESFLRTSQFRELIQRFTIMELENASEILVRCFIPGDYTLMNDKCKEGEGVDCLFMVPCGETELAEWQSEWGGETHYVHDKETLLTLSPADNTFNIILRDSETMKFVKMMNTNSPQYRKEFGMTFSEKL